MHPGPRNLITDVPGLLVGNAQDDVLKSGVTVLTAATPFTASVSILGGAPGTRETDLLAPDKSVSDVDALVLSGGSAFGLEACTGVTDSLRAANRGYAVGPARVPIVPGAILFDLLNGGQKDWQKNPYGDLGRAAFHAAGEIFQLGTLGAGTGATTGTLKGGLGSASLRLDGGLVIGALVAANPMGSVTTPGNRYFYAAPFEVEAEFGGQGTDPSVGLGRDWAGSKAATAERANTTIGIVATNAALDTAQCQRVAIAAHAGLARAIVPSHTPMDGDLVFSVATGARALNSPIDDLGRIGHAAALCVSRAIARGIYAAAPSAGDLVPCWQELNAVSGPAD